MRTEVGEERDPGAAFELAGGCAAVVVAAFVTAAAFGPAEPVARALFMAVAAGLLAAVVRDRWAAAGVTVIAALVFVGFLAHQAGQLTGDPTPWRYTLIIGSAALLGRAQRWARTAQYRTAQYRVARYRAAAIPARSPGSTRSRAGRPDVDAVLTPRRG